MQRMKAATLALMILPFMAGCSKQSERQEDVFAPKGRSAAAEQAHKTVPIEKGNYQQ